MFGDLITFQEIFKKSFRENFYDKQAMANLQLEDVLVVLMVTLALALFVFVIYRFTYQGIIYSHSFNVSLVMTALITALIIVTIQSNVILSLGMVGALSIVRFRTAVKDPMDIVYMFFAIAVGITTGTGLFYIAIGGTLFIGVVLLVMSLLKVDKKKMMLIIWCEKESEKLVQDLLDKMKASKKSRVLQDGRITLTMEVRENKKTLPLLEKLEATEGVVKTSTIAVY